MAGRTGQPPHAAAAPTGAACPVRVVGVDVPFGSTVRFTVKWAIASVPALISFALLGVLLVAVLTPFLVLEGPVDHVVRANEEIGTASRELVRGRQHHFTRALPIGAVHTLHLIRERVRVHRHLGMTVRAEQLRALHADGPIAESRVFVG